jgi:hypothetical protein
MLGTRREPSAPAMTLWRRKVHVSYQAVRGTQVDTYHAALLRRAEVDL